MPIKTSRQRTAAVTVNAEHEREIEEILAMASRYVLRAPFNAVCQQVLLMFREHREPTPEELVAWGKELNDLMAAAMQTVRDAAASARRVRQEMAHGR
jgi:hypothetical protein